MIKENMSISVSEVEEVVCITYIENVPYAVTENDQFRIYPEESGKIEEKCMIVVLSSGDYLFLTESEFKVLTS